MRGIMVCTQISTEGGEETKIFWFKVIKNRRTPTIVIVKCGTESEAANDKKPGNRGKRDSQLVLMNFFSRVTYNDRMTPLDFDMFRKIQVLMGVTPDFFEVSLMVCELVTQRHGHSISPLGGCRYQGTPGFDHTAR